MHVLAARDYTGGSQVLPPAPAGEPNYVSFYQDALAANQIGYDVYDVDDRGRTAPTYLGVLSHYRRSSGTRATESSRVSLAGPPVMRPASRWTSFCTSAPT